MTLEPTTKKPHDFIPVNAVMENLRALHHSTRSADAPTAPTINVPSSKPQQASAQAGQAPSSPSPSQTGHQTETVPRLDKRALSDLQSFIRFEKFEAPSHTEWPPAFTNSPATNLTIRRLRRVYDGILWDEGHSPECLRSVHFGPEGKGFVIIRDRQFRNRLVDCEWTSFVSQLRRWGFICTQTPQGDLYCDAEGIFARGHRHRLHDVTRGGRQAGDEQDFPVKLFKILSAVPPLDAPGATFYGWASKGSSEFAINDNKLFDLTVAVMKMRLAEGITSVHRSLDVFGFDYEAKDNVTRGSHPAWRQGDESSAMAANKDNASKNKSAFPTGQRKGKVPTPASTSAPASTRRASKSQKGKAKARTPASLPTSAAARSQTAQSSGTGAMARTPAPAPISASASSTARPSPKSQPGHGKPAHLKDAGHNVSRRVSQTEEDRSAPPRAGSSTATGVKRPRRVVDSDSDSDRPPPTRGGGARKTIRRLDPEDEDDSDQQPSGSSLNPAIIS